MRRNKPDPKDTWKPSIDDIINKGCNPTEVEPLCDIFEELMRRMARDSLIRKGWFHLEDFEYAKRAGVEMFTVMMERYPHAGAEQWIGLFKAKGRCLRLFGILEPYKD